VLEAAVIKAAMAGLVAPRHHVVVLQQIHNDLCVKVGGDAGSLCSLYNGSFVAAAMIKAG
jgi:hypothetical protein